MKSKIYITITLLFCFGQLSFGQTAKQIKGEKYFKNYSYSKSIKKYEQISDKTTKINRELAQGYYNTSDYKNAEKYFAIVVTADDKTPEDLYNYASVLAINQKYKESEEWMMKFNNTVKNDSRAKRFINNKNFRKDILKDKGQYFIQTLNINSKQEDFGVTYYKDKLVYASTKNPPSIIKRKWNWNNLPFLNLYVADTDSNMQISNRKPLRRINKKYHEGPASFSKDGNFMVFTKNDYKGKSKDGVVNLQLFSSEYKDGKWQKENSLHFNSSEYSVGHPALTPDGNTMYFASNMPGGIGGTDLYVVHRKEGVWGTPKNLGKEINTEGNEMFPFIHESNILFFSSDGQLGIGGLDIFYTKLKDGKFSKVKNVGSPINSSYDDFSFVVDSVMKTGYFASNREGGKGDDDIYAFTIKKPFGIIIKGTVIDNQNNVLTNSKVSLYNSKGDVIKTVITDDTGKFSFAIDPDNKYKIDGTKKEYSKDEEKIDTKGVSEDIYIDLILKRIPKFNIFCTVTDKKTKKKIDKVKVILVNNVSNKTETINCETGDFKRDIKNLFLNDKISYKMTLIKKGYMTKDFAYSKILDKEGEYRINVEMDKIKVGSDLGKMVNVKPIYFDLNKHNIRPDAATELDKIVKVMNEYPSMVVELGSHTDSRGSNASNRRLSQRRATSSANYIKKRITKPGRIYGKGYGESKNLIVTNEFNKQYNFLPVGQKLTPRFIYSLPKNQQKIAHQLNRRTEFKIIKM